MEYLLETVSHAGGPQPVNIAIGLIVFLVLAAAMALLHGLGAGRPHS